MKPSARRKWKSSDELSPREKRELINRGEWVEEEEEDEGRGKAPLLFRILAWISLIVIFFAIGYGATSLVFSWIDRERPGRTPANLVATPEQAEDLIASIKSNDEVSEQSYRTFTVSIPDGATFAKRQIRCRAGIREDEMQQTLSAYMDAVKESKMLDPAANSLNLFQSGDWLYLNVNQNFLDSVKALDQERATFLLSGLVKTMSDNFAPVNKVKFYVNGKEVKDKKPVDLTMPWGLRGS
jgi:hypothetical protein